MKPSRGTRESVTLVNSIEFSAFSTQAHHEFSALYLIQCRELTISETRCGGLQHAVYAGKLSLQHGCDPADRVEVLDVASVHISQVTT